VTGKPKISTCHKQVLPDIDLWPTRFHIDWDKYMTVEYKIMIHM